jgi:Flp pilus assembly protein protease CpaA
MLWIVLFILAMAVSLYDLRTGKVPNWVSLPLLCAGVIAHFPGTANIWFSCLMIFFAWYLAWMSAGDAKLWMALLWVLPLSDPAAMPLAFFSTGLLQILIRKVKNQPLTGVRTPGAWRTIPFILWSLHVH